MALLDRFKTQPRHRHPDPAVRLAFVEEIPIDDREQLAAIARDDEDARVIGSIARHAAVEAVRGAALERLQDHDEILAVAMNSDFKDTALAALDRISTRADLEHVAARAKNKSAAKRARASVREMDERAAAEAEAAGPPPPDPAEVARLGALREIRARAQ